MSHPSKIKGRRSIYARLWSRVAIDDTSKCWEWQGYRQPRGHGQIGNPGRHKGTRPTHQVAWEFFNNMPVPAGLQILHHCDNPPCCNPNHLYAGTPQDNVNDAMARGRTARGFRLPHTRLSDDQIREIRRRHVPEFALYRTGANGRIVRYRSNSIELAKEFGVTNEYMHQIIRGVYRRGAGGLTDG